MFKRTAELLSSDDPKDIVETFIDDAVGKQGAFQTMPGYARQASNENASMLNLLLQMTPAPINLDNLNTPTLLICGEETRDFYKITANGLAQQRHCIEVKRIPGANHLWPLLDIDAFCSLLAE